MIINFLGDSITEGAITTSYDKCFIEQLKKLLNADVRNYGKGGTRIARQHHVTPENDWGEDYCARAPKMQNDADLVFVFGGTNDYGHGDAPMGKMGDKTPDTFYGAMDYLINELLRYYKKDQIAFILPLSRIDEDKTIHNSKDPEIIARYPLEDYRKVMVEVLDKYQIEILDFRKEIGPGENNPLLADGLHPNDKGHYLLATLLAKYIKEKTH